MKRAAAILLAAFLLAPAALALRPPQDGVHPWLPPRWEQRREVTLLLRRGGPVYCAAANGDAVALTFDDGPGPYSEQLLAELRAWGARATFFLVGNRLRYWPQVARDEARLGALGDHTWSHPRLTELPSWLVRLELGLTQWAIARDAGVRPRLFRSPYELHSRATDAIVRGFGLVQVLWSVDSRDDVPHARVADVVRNVVAGLRPGAIVELHDIHPWTVQAVPLILRAIALRGLRAVSLPELLALQPPTPDQPCP